MKNKRSFTLKAVLMFGAFWWLYPHFVGRPRDLDMAKEIAIIVVPTALVSTWYFNRFILKKQAAS